MAQKQDKIKTAALLINMGGPENLSEVRGFIRRLFSDPHIIRMPQPMRGILSAIMAYTRAPKVRKHYQLIGGSSPLKKWTSRQAELVSDRLSVEAEAMPVAVAYSYSQPSVLQAMEALTQDGIENIIAVPLYPHFSDATLGSIYADIDFAGRRLRIMDRIKTIRPFYDDPRYIRSSADMLNLALPKVDRARKFRVIFSAHALPQSFIDKGDPYRQQVEKTVSLICEQVPLNDWVLSFQSKIGPVKWMQPSTIETVKQAAEDGITQIVIMSIGFVCDHVETLYELDIELAAIAREAGIKTSIRAGVFNDYPPFANMLASLIREAIS